MVVSATWNKCGRKLIVSSLIVLRLNFHGVIDKEFQPVKTKTIEKLIRQTARNLFKDSEVCSMIFVSFTLALIIVSLEGTIQNPEGNEIRNPPTGDTQMPDVGEVQRGLQALDQNVEEATQKREREKLLEDRKKAQEELPQHPRLKIIMFAQVVRRVNPVKDITELLPSDGDLGRHFIMTDELYKMACAEIPGTLEYTGEHDKWGKIARHVIVYPEGDRREVNMVFCRAHPRPFFLRKVDDRNYMIYRETWDA